jgi:hypothetical protein
LALKKRKERMSREKKRERRTWARLKKHKVFLAGEIPKREPPAAVFPAAPASQTATTPDSYNIADAHTEKKVTNKRCTADDLTVISS